MMGHPLELLLGRTTYEIFAAAWPQPTDPAADRLNRARKHVASKTLRSVDWSNSTLIGSGKRLLADGTIPAAFKIADVKTSGTGVVSATYERAGAVKLGSFAPEEAEAAEVRAR